MMAVFWIGDGPSRPLCDVIPRSVRSRIESRRVPRASDAEADRAVRVAGGGSALERLPPDLAKQILTLDGYNLTAELLRSRVSTRLREMVGDKPLVMCTQVRPLLRTWRDVVFPPPRRRVNSFTHSPSKRKARNRAILFF